MELQMLRGAKDKAFLAIKSCILIYTNAFLDEWDKFLLQKAEDSNKDVIRELKKKADPAIKRIRKWKGIKAYRNSVLAHNLRIKNKYNQEVYVFKGNDVKKLSIPDHITEILLLSDLIDLATTIVSEPFSNEINKKRDELYKPDFIQQDPIDVEFELKQVKAEINLACKCKK